MPRLLFGLLCLLAVALGCEKTAPYTDNSRDSEAYAKSIKELVLGTANGAKGSREPADNIRPLVDELKQTDRPVGEHAGTYAKMLTIASAIVADGDKAQGRPANLDQQLAELVKLADALPGEVKIARPSDD